MSAAKNPIRVGIVGLGRAGWGMHCTELEKRTDTFKIVAGCDPVKARREQVVEKFGAKAYASIDKLIADPDVEVVSIATRSPDHVEHAIKAMAAGKIVFCEKPIAMNYEEAKVLMKAAKKYPGKLFIRHNRRFEAAFNQIEDIIRSGKIGDVHEVKLRRLGYSRRDDWQAIINAGGGQLLNWGPHIVDHALQFLGSPVASMWSDLKKVAAVGDAEDQLKIVLRGENGIVVDLEISGGAAINEPVFSVAGSKGALTSNEKTIELKYLDSKVRLAPRRAKVGNPEYGSFGTKEDLPWIHESLEVRKDMGPDCIWDALYETIRNGKPFRVTLEESLEVMRILTLARKGTPFQN